MNKKKWKTVLCLGIVNLYWMPWSVRMDHLQKLQDSEGAGSNQ